MKKGILWGLAVLMPAILACGEAALAWEKDENSDRGQSQHLPRDSLRRRGR